MEKRHSFIKKSRGGCFALLSLLMVSCAQDGANENEEYSNYKTSISLNMEIDKNKEHVSTTENGINEIGVIDNCKFTLYGLEALWYTNQKDSRWNTVSCWGFTQIEVDIEWEKYTHVLDYPFRLFLKMKSLHYPYDNHDLTFYNEAMESGKYVMSNWFYIKKAYPCLDPNTRGAATIRLVGNEGICKPYTAYIDDIALQCPMFIDNDQTSEITLCLQYKTSILSDDIATIVVHDMKINPSTKEYYFDGERIFNN